jgi:hypothetical protein
MKLKKYVYRFKPCRLQRFMLPVTVLPQTLWMLVFRATLCMTSFCAGYVCKLRAASQDSKLLPEVFIHVFKDLFSLSVCAQILFAPPEKLLIYWLLTYLTLKIMVK